MTDLPDLTNTPVLVLALLPYLAEDAPVKSNHPDNAIKTVIT